MSSNKLIPALRFPEFLNEGEWQEEQLGEISEIVRGGSPRPIQDYITNDSDGLNWLKIADVQTDAKYITSTKEKVLKEALSSTREVNAGDLILSNSMSFGRPYISKIKTCIHDGWIAIRKIANKTFEDYLYYSISSDSSQYYFQTNAAGAAVKNLNAEIIKLLPIHLPKNKAEQQKIAACLSSLDELITAHSKKLELLKSHKKGLMQNLFPQKSESGFTRLKDDRMKDEDEQKILQSQNPQNPDSDNIPKYRFKEFENDGEWVEYSFDELLDNILDFRGRTPLKLGMQWGGGNIISLSANNVKNGYIDFNAECNLGSKELHNIWMGKVNLEKGDIVFTMEAPLGNAVLIPNAEKYILSQRVVAFKTKQLVENEFLIQLIWNESFQNQIEKLSTGSTAKGINQKSLSKVIVSLPQKAKEQQKIASCLSAVDALITAQAEKIAQLQLHKKGLMQGLFPKVAV